MNASRFDTLVKRIAMGSTSRRRLLRGLGGGLLGAVLGTGDVGADPACRVEGHPCEGDQDCCDELVCMASGPGEAMRCTALSTTTTPAPTTTTTTTAPPCDATTCPDGCCDTTGVCQAGTVDTVCGAGGAGCQDCNARSEICSGGACVAPTTMTTSTTTTTTTPPPSCPAGTCPSGANSCVSPVGCSATNGSCDCHQSVEGFTVCVAIPSLYCNATPCSSSAECGAGASCIHLLGPHCGCPAGTTVCFPCCTA